MKRICSVFLCAVLIIGLCACGQSGPTWQEQYDLGVRYLEEGNYEEAAIAFTAAIEIDPKQALGYVGRGDAYVGKAEILTPQSEEYVQAEADYLAAIEIDASVAELYKKLADLYLAVGDTEKAISILEQGYETTEDETLHIRRQELGVSGSDEVIWTDPVFERLVRDKIGIPTGPVYVRDLDYITSLGIFGDTFILINGDESLYDGYGWKYVDVGRTQNGVGPNHATLLAYYGYQDEEFTTRGQITNVDSLQYFRNLNWVEIIANHITNVAVLREMKNIEQVSFWANDISDLSPISELQELDWENEEQFLEIGDIVSYEE
jgi:tetratricopeptide (TPR) repeat protein